MTGTRETGGRPPRVLVVEDEPTIAEVVARYLERAGYATTTAGDGAEALGLAASEPPDLVVLDLMLPGLGGLEVMRLLHERDGPRIPVVVLTAKGEPGDRVIGLRRGADDYVAKPFSPAELVARVDAVLRRARRSGGSREPMRFDGLEIDPGARAVTVRGAAIELTAREFDLLAFMAAHPGQVFSRDQLMDAVWGDSLRGDTSTVTVHIRRLRAKIEADATAPRRLQTVWGVGYRFAP